MRDADEPLDAELATLAKAFHITLLDPPRPADARRFGVPARLGHWFVDAAAPDPHSFGTCLAMLERFVLDRTDAAHPPILLGAGQGATLVLSLACCWAERLRAVIAFDAYLPDFPEGGLHETPLAGLPILLTSDPPAPPRFRRGVRELEARAGKVTAVVASPERRLDKLLPWLARLA